ncbi:MAG: N-acetylglucosamine-6-phosphate deacetylase [Chloroflexi bacterium]|nr:N-acetylglucosamine-6-phosphate deacetylase [Chloroflexota bacterium]
MTIQAFVNGTLMTPSQVIPDGVLLVQGDQVHALGTREQVRLPSDAKLIDAQGKLIAPGLVDIHTYGCLGVSITSPATAAAELDAFARHVARFGVTRFLISPTMGNCAFIARLLAALADAIPRTRGGARPLGIHLEGPWLDPEQRGAFPPSVLHAPTLDEAREYWDAARGGLRLVTLAGNLPNAPAVARFFGEQGVRVSFGHSNTTYDHARDLLASGAFPLVTHVYNAMSGLHHRKPGVLGAVLSSDAVMGMLICDGIHAHPAAVKILVRALGVDRVILVTDAIPGGGMTEGTFTMLNQTARIVDGVARLEDGTIAGSILTLNRAVMNARAYANLALNDALALVTTNPARALGLTAQGALAPGMDADVIVMDETGRVALTMVAGQVVFDAFA